MIFLLFLDLKKVRTNLALVKASLKDENDKSFVEKKNLTASVNMELKNLSDESSLRIQKEPSIIEKEDDFSASHRKLLENEGEEEKFSYQKALLKISELEHKLKAMEKQLQDSKIFCQMLKTENKALIQKISQEYQEKKKYSNEEESKFTGEYQKNMTLLSTHCDHEDIFLEEKSKKNLNSESIQKKKMLQATWNHDEKNFEIDFFHFKIMNNKKKNEQQNILSKNGIITVQQQIYNATSEPIFFESCTVTSSSGC